MSCPVRPAGCSRSTSDRARSAGVRLERDPAGQRPGQGEVHDPRHRPGTDRWTYRLPAGSYWPNGAGGFTDTAMVLYIDADATSPLGPTIALDLRNGATLWTRPGNGYANVPDTSTSLYEMADSTTAIRIADGKPLWNLPIPFPDDSGPRPRSTRSASTTFLNAAVGNLLHTIDATTGQVLWTRPTVQAEPQLQATADTVFLLDGPLPTLDQRTGTLRWTTKPLPGSLEPALVTVAGMVVTGIVATGGAAGLSAWDMADGRPLWHYPHPAGQLDQDWTLVISGDYLIAFFDADLLVFRPARGTHAPTWESGGGDSIYRA